MTILLSKNSIKPKASIVYDTYWRFATERQNIFFKRLKEKLNFTEDSILQKHKFTNAYRASDRVSQYLIKNVIYNGNQNEEEVFFRIILFKIFNKIETWEYLIKEFGEVNYKNYLFKDYDHLFSSLKNSKQPIYSGAYIMASGKSAFGYELKHQNHLKLIERMMIDKLVSKIIKQKSMANVFYLLKEYPTIGNFLAYQYAIDINYSELTSFSEMDFVVPGPGALDGIKKCFSNLGDYNETSIIKYVTENQFYEFNRLGLDFKTLWGRPLQLIDCQNIFCEVDKYARLAHPEINSISNRKEIKQLFRPKKNPIDYWYPPKWELNSNINQFFC
jgi:hypothetical protein